MFQGVILARSLRYAFAEPSLFVGRESIEVSQSLVGIVARRDVFKLVWGKSFEGVILTV